MDIREKTLAGLIAIFAVVTVTLLVLSLTIFPDSYRAIEAKDVTDDMHQIVANIDDEFANLGTSVSDWGPWDDLYGFVLGQNPTFVDDNLQKNTYTNLHLSFIAITDTRGTIVYSRSLNSTDGTFEPLPAGLAEAIRQDPSPLRPANASGPDSGFLLVPGTTVMAASYPILHSDLSGPPAGTLIMGRYLDDAEIRTFGLPSQSPPSLTPLQPGPANTGSAGNVTAPGKPAITVLPVSEQLIEGRTTLRDITGRDALTLSFQKPRDFYQQGKETIQFFLLVLLAIMLILGVFVISRIDRSILSRLNQVIADTRAVSDGSGLRIRKNGNDEIAQLAEAMNTMIGRIEQSHSDLRDSEEKLRSFVRESTDGYVLVGSGGQVIEWNAANERITGITRAEAVGTPYIDLRMRLLVPEHRTQERIERMKNAAVDLVTTGEYPQFYQPAEIGIVRPDGARRTLQQTAFPIRTSGEQLFGIINRDITGYRLAEEALRQSRRKLNLLNTVTFQDIRNAVFAMAGYHGLVMASARDPEGRDYLEKENNLLRQVDDLLTSAKDYQDLGINPPTWHDVNQVFIFAASHLDTLKIDRTVRLDGLAIFADALFEKVFFNLLENSLLHGGGVTEISLTYRKTPTGFELTFGDNGKGIAPADKEKIFDRGYRKGFGLFLVREILSITGMTIRETGAEGEGARFVISVPEGMYRFGDGGIPPA